MRPKKMLLKLRRNLLWLPSDYDANTDIDKNFDQENDANNVSSQSTLVDPLTQAENNLEGASIEMQARNDDSTDSTGKSDDTSTTAGLFSPSTATQELSATTSVPSAVPLLNYF